MGLSKKTFLYSIALAVIMVAFVTGYFVFMLPSLYVDYVMESNLDSIIEIQEGYMEQRNYDELSIKNPTATYSLEIPLSGDKIYVSGKFFKLSLEMQDEELKGLLSALKQMIQNMRNEEQMDAFESFSWDDISVFWEETLKDKFIKEDYFEGDAPVKVEIEHAPSGEVYEEEYYKLHMVSESLVVCEAGVSDENYGYINYTAIGWTDDALIISVLPTMTPQMEEIRPVVMGSLPMIIAVVFLLVLISSRFFSGKIVNPIIRLRKHAEIVKTADDFEITEFDESGGDEVGILGKILNELYEKLRDSYLELEEKNRILEEENERQEVFLRASSHQLKTPVAAALLLTEGMMNEVGKYKDTKEFLPEVKKQLLSMKNIIDDILSLNYHVQNMQKEKIEINMLAREIIKAYEVQIEDKKLEIELKGTGIIETDREMIKIIMDNLISNAVWYTPGGEKIEIHVDKENFRIRNYGVTIDEKLLPDIYKPFVSGAENVKGKGLGLYVVSYYVRVLGYLLKIDNIENGVQSTITFVK